MLDHPRGLLPAVVHASEAGLFAEMDVGETFVGNQGQAAGGEIMLTESVAAGLPAPVRRGATEVREKSLPSNR